MSRVVVTPRPLAPPFRAPARRARLVADERGLHWQDADGRTTTWAHGADDAPATAQVLNAARARGLPGVPPGPLLVVGDAADRPLLAVPVADWAGSPPATGTGDPLRGTALRPLVDALQLAARAPGADGALASALAGVPVAAVGARWSGPTRALTVVAVLALAVGSGLGIARGRSLPLAALALLGLLGLVVAGVGPLLRARLTEQRAAGAEVAAVRADGRRGPALLLVRTEGGLDIGVREADGVERWLPVGDGGVTGVRRVSAALELTGDDGTVLLALDARRWLPDDTADAALTALCERAGVARRDVPGRNAPPPVAGSDLPPAAGLWPRDYPAGALAAVAGLLGLLNGWALWRDTGLDGARPLGVAFLAVGAAGVGTWLWAGRRR